MAKATIILTDEPDGQLHMEVEFDPELKREEFEARDLTEAQAVALLVIQDLVTDQLGRASAQQFDQEEAKPLQIGAGTTVNEKGSADGST